MSQLAALWGKQSRGRRLGAIGAIAAVAVIIVVSQFAGRAARYAVVAEVGPDDAQELYAMLVARDLPVRLREGKVEIEADRATEARAIAAAAGLPRAGKGLETFEGSSLGQSAFAEQVNFRRALQAELARSITSLAQVESARVHLALGRRSVFKEQDEAASASVALHLHPRQSLAAEQVRGVRQLVAASIDGMKPEAVVIVDQHGNLLDAANPGGQDKRADLEHTLTLRVRTMLERVVGAGKVSVVTTAVLDESKVSETQEVYDQATPIVRSESRTIEGGGDAGAGSGGGGVAGTRGNLPGAGGAAPAPEGAKRFQESKNYEVNRIVRQTARPDTQLKRLHVAIIVDNKLGADGKSTPRDKDELAELAALARQAAGIDDARGDKLELRSIAFAAEEAGPPAAEAAADSLPLIPIAIGGGALLVVAIAAILLLKRKRKRAAEDTKPLSLALPAPVAELERALDAAPATLAGIEEPRGLPPGKSTRDRVLEVVRTDAERAAEVMTGWLSETAALPKKSDTRASSHATK
jgi:flagellar M-ring protein FliF